MKTAIIFSSNFLVMYFVSNFPLQFPFMKLAMVASGYYTNRSVQNYTHSVQKNIYFFRICMFPFYIAK